MELYQNNLDQNKKKVYFGIEVEDQTKAINLLTDNSIPVNGPYQDPVEIITHEKVEELNIENDDTKLSVMEEVYNELDDIISDSWTNTIEKINYLLEESDDDDEEINEENSDEYDE